MLNFLYSNIVNIVNSRISPNPCKIEKTYYLDLLNNYHDLMLGKIEVGLSSITTVHDIFNVVELTKPLDVFSVHLAGLMVMLVNFFPSIEQSISTASLSIYNIDYSNTVNISKNILYYKALFGIKYMITYTSYFSSYDVLKPVAFVFKTSNIQISIFHGVIYKLFIFAQAYPFIFLPLLGVLSNIIVNLGDMLTTFLAYFSGLSLDYLNKIISNCLLYLIHILECLFFVFSLFLNIGNFLIKLITIILRNIFNVLLNSKKYIFNLLNKYISNLLFNYNKNIMSLDKKVLDFFSTFNDNKWEDYPHKYVKYFTSLLLRFWLFRFIHNSLNREYTRKIKYEVFKMQTYTFIYLDIARRIFSLHREGYSIGPHLQSHNLPDKLK